MVFERLHGCPVLTAVIAPRFHGHSQIIRSSESGDKKGHQKRQQVLGFLDQTALLKVSTSGDLGFHDLIRLLHEDGDESEGDGHHHGNLMHGDPDLIQGLHKPFQTVCKLVRCCGQRHDRGADNQVDQPDADPHGLQDTFLCDL